MGQESPVCWGGNVDHNPILVLIGVLVGLGIMFAVRELLCWYIKATTIVSRMDEVIRLLGVIAEDTDPS